jgi:putative ATP-dependent endonuclease of OLD family
LRVSRITIANFRGVSSATILLPNHAVLIGDNNTGKTTILEALDLALGPDRLNRMPPVDEHDFFQGKYVATAADPPTGEGIQAAAGSDVAGAAGVAAGDVGGDPQPAEGEGSEAPRIEIEVTIADLTE